MDYQAVTVWTVLKRFILGWLVTGMILVVISCVEYKEFIITAFANNTWAWVNAIMPVVIIIWAIWYMLRSVFR